MALLTAHRLQHFDTSMSSAFVGLDQSETRHGAEPGKRVSSLTHMNGVDTFLG